MEVLEQRQDNHLLLHYKAVAPNSLFLAAHRSQNPMEELYKILLSSPYPYTFPSRWDLGTNFSKFTGDSNATEFASIGEGKKKQTTFLYHIRFSVWGL